MNPGPPPAYRAHRWVLFAVLVVAGALLCCVVLPQLLR